MKGWDWEEEIKELLITTMIKLTYNHYLIFHGYSKKNHYNQLIKKKNGLTLTLMGRIIEQLVLSKK